MLYLTVAVSPAIAQDQPAPKSDKQAKPPEDDLFSVPAPSAKPAPKPVTGDDLFGEPAPTVRPTPKSDKQGKSPGDDLFGDPTVQPAPSVRRTSVSEKEAQPPAASAIVRGLNFAEFKPAKPCRRFALCVGIDGYQKESGYPRLKFAGADAARMSEVLLKECEFDYVLLLTDAAVTNRFSKLPGSERLEVVPDVSRSSIRDRAEQFFAQADREDDVVVFYFAGHGDAKPSVALIAADYDQRKAPWNYLDIHDLNRWFQYPARASTRLLIFDACRASPLGGKHTMAPAFIDELNRPDKDLVVMSACSSKQAAWEDSAAGHGRYTSLLIEGLAGAGKAFRVGAQEITHDDLGKYVENQFELKNWIHGQTPCVLGGKKGVSVVLRRRSAEEAVPQAAKRTRDGARDAYQRADLNSANGSYQIAIEAQREVAQSADAHRILGQMLAERGRVLYRLGSPFRDDLQSVRDEAAKLCPDAPGLHEVRAYELLQDDKATDALIAFATAEAGYADQPAQLTPHFLSQYGVARYQTKDYAAAAELFRRAALRSVELKLLKAASRQLEQAAECYDKIGNHAEAYKLLTAAMKIIRSLSSTDETDDLRKAAFLGRTSMLLVAVGALDAAYDAAADAVWLRRQRNQINRSDYARSLQTVARIELLRHNVPSAQSIFNEAQAIARRATDADPVLVYRLAQDQSLVSANPRTLEPDVLIPDFVAQGRFDYAEFPGRPGGAQTMQPPSTWIAATPGSYDEFRLNIARPPRAPIDPTVPVASLVQPPSLTFHRSGQFGDGYSLNIGGPTSVQQSISAATLKSTGICCAPARNGWWGRHRRCPAARSTCTMKSDCVHRRWLLRNR